MFRKKSLRSSKDYTTSTSSSSPEPPTVAAAAAVVAARSPQQAPRPVAKKVEAHAAKPAGPVSIVPAGTKRVLVVGKFVVMTADVENCDAVIVQGNLDGNIKAKYIVIMKGGCMRGKVECQEADVAGSFEGMEMVVHNRLTLSATARVGGRTTYHRLSVHDGAVLTGELQFKPSLRSGKKTSSLALEAAPTTTSVPAETTAVAATKVAPEDEHGDSADTVLAVNGKAQSPPEEEDSTQ